MGEANNIPKTLPNKIFQNNFGAQPTLSWIT
jgi:hypothetical protein